MAKVVAAGAVMALSIGVAGIGTATAVSSSTSTVGDVVGATAPRSVLAWAAATRTPSLLDADPAATGNDLAAGDRSAAAGSAAAPLGFDAATMPLELVGPGSTVVANPWLGPSMPMPVPADAPELELGDASPPVHVLEQRLTELGYRPGLVDGYFSDSTWSAVLAFQKAEGLERSGSVEATTWAHLADPQARRASYSTTYPRVEVDLERQVVLVVLGPEHVVTLNTSTGGGYDYLNQYGYYETAETPTGAYQVYRRYDGLEKAPLGTLYRPLYFHLGYALHGSPYVPDYPDSHGCVRLSDEDMDWMWEWAPDDLSVTVFASMDPAQLFPEDLRRDADGEPVASPELLTPL